MPIEYVSAPILTQPSEMEDVAFDYMAGVSPGWVPVDTQLDTWILAANARMAAEVRDVAADVPASIFRYFGAKLAGITPLDSTAATVNVTITAINNAGYTIPAGYTAGVRDAAGVLWGFRTTADVVIGTGSTFVAGVTLTAAVKGKESTNLGATNQLMELVTTLNSVATVKMESATGNGQDAEDDDVYRDRLARQLALQAPRPILPNDFASFAINNPAVGRALALDGYSPPLGTFGNSRTITVAIAGYDGMAVSTPVKTAVNALLQSQREVNFLIYVVDPNYTTIDVQFTATAFPGYDATAVRDAIVANIQALLNPATFGSQPGDGGLDWYLTPTITYQALVIAAGQALGVKSIDTLVFRTGANPYAATPVALAGAAPLPLSGAISGAVS